MKAETGAIFRERILSEYCRVQQLTNGNRNKYGGVDEGVMKASKRTLRQSKPRHRKSLRAKALLQPRWMITMSQLTRK